MTDEDSRRLHDLRHLLTAILGALASPVSDANIDVARRAATAAAQLLDGGAGGVTLLSLQDFWVDTEPLLRRLIGPTILLEMVLPPPGTTVHADPQQLRRILMNLVANARDAMQAGGTVRVQATRDGANAVICVTDTGVGIPPDLLGHVFVQGVTTKPGGSGLGLAIVHDLVRAAGGSVCATNGGDSVCAASGGGAVITIRWPLAPYGPIGATILLVEDEPMVRNLAEQALRRAGMRVIAVENAEHALVIAGQTPLHAVVTDLSLPGMLDGRSLIAALRETEPDLPALLVSGYADSDCLSDLGRKTMAFLGKPYTLSGLVAAVRRIVRD